MGPWYFRFFLILFFLLVFSKLSALAFFMIGAASVYAVIRLLYELERLPRKIMDILDRLTNKPELERKYNEKQQEAVIINSEELIEFMRGKLVGQDEVILSVAQQLRRRIAAKRKGKPLAVFCFAGPPGVGKTYFAQVLAEKLFGNPKHLLFFDMSLYSQPHAASSMFGQAKGYVGSNTYGTLTAGLRDFPKSIVLLDEFEKAHPEVHKRFLTAWNDGFVTEVSDGAKVSTSEAIFILTTNAASKKLGELASRYEGSHRDFSEAIKKVLQEAAFAPEVLSRIDDFFGFKPIQGLNVARVVALEIEKVVHQYQLELVEGGIDVDILMQTLEQEDKYTGGVREMARAIENQIADSIIDAKTQRAKEISLRFENGTITTKIESYRPVGEEDNEEGGLSADEGRKSSDTAGGLKLEKS